MKKKPVEILPAFFMSYGNQNDIDLLNFLTFNRNKMLKILFIATLKTEDFSNSDKNLTFVMYLVFIGLDWI